MTFFCIPGKNNNNEWPSQNTWTLAKNSKIRAQKKIQSQCFFLLKCQFLENFTCTIVHKASGKHNLLHAHLLLSSELTDFSPAQIAINSCQSCWKLSNGFYGVFQAVFEIFLHLLISFFEDLSCLRGSWFWHNGSAFNSFLWRYLLPDPRTSLEMDGTLNLPVFYGVVWKNLINSRKPNIIMQSYMDFFLDFLIESENMKVHW